MAGFTVTTSNITDTTVIISVAASMPLPEEEGNIVITVTASGTQVAAQSVTPSGAEGVAVSANFTGLTANTGYTATFTSSAGDGTTTFTTKTAGYNSPKTATQEQWEDLADRVKAKADASAIPSPSDSITSVSTTGTGGTATTWSRSDHTHSISGSTVTSALGYTPYNSTNPNGYTSNTGTITAVRANGTSVATSGIADIPAATTSAYGVTQLTNSYSSTSTTTAATPSSVRSAYNLAAEKAKITVQASDPGEGATLAAGNFIAVYGE